MLNSPKVLKLVAGLIGVFSLLLPWLLIVSFQPEATQAPSQQAPSIVSSSSFSQTTVDGQVNQKPAVIVIRPAQTTDTVTNCESAGGPLAWVLCELLRLVSGVLNWGESQAIDHLRIESSAYGKDLYRDVWKQIRNLMTFVIIGTALFMVLSTALDVGMFQNYTVKKYLPRLVVGTILIQFSWLIGDLMIQALTQIGDLLAQIVYAVDPAIRSFSLGDIAISGGVFTDLAGLAGLAVGGFYAILLLPVTVTLAFGLLIAVLFFGAREFIVIALLIFSPLGLAFWIAPGNDKMWRIYFKTFFYLLLIYPLIATSIALGKLFAFMIVQDL